MTAHHLSNPPIALTSPQTRRRRLAKLATDAATEANEAAMLHRQLANVG